MDIRPFEPEHTEAAARLWLESWRSAGLDTQEGAPLEDIVSRMRADLADVWEAYLGWEGDRLVGFLALKPDEACVDQIFVVADGKREGRGTRLLDFAKARMPEGFWLRPAADNQAACRFYERHGMRPDPPAPHPRMGHLTVVYRWP